MRNRHDYDCDCRVLARTAWLTADDVVDDDGDGGPWRFSGTAVAPGDILHTDDGQPVLFTAEELEQGAETQSDEPLTKDHPEDDEGIPEYPPPTDETIGRVVAADYIEGEGVAYEATTHDPEIARGVQGHSYDVSVHPTFELGPVDDETGARIAKNIEFLDLSVVSKGDSPNNTAQWGPNQALASWTETNRDLDNDSEGSFREIIRETVHGTLSAMGSPESNDDTVATDAQQSDEGAESSTDDTDSDQDTTMGDDNGDPDDGQQSVDPDDGDDPTIADLTVEELGEALREQGFVTEENASEIVQEATAQQSKQEKVGEIIAQSDEYDEDDREELMGSAEALIEREHDRVTGEPASQLPGSAGITASARSPGVDLDDGGYDDVAIGLADAEGGDD